MFLAAICKFKLHFLFVLIFGNLKSLKKQPNILLNPFCKIKKIKSYFGLKLIKIYFFIVFFYGKKYFWI